MSADKGLTDLVVLTVVVDLPSPLVRSLTDFCDILVVPFQKDPSQLSADCEKLAPCVLLARERYILAAGPSLISDLTRRDAPTRIVAIGSLDTSVIADLLHLGCAGALRLDTAPSEMRRAIHAVANGELWFPRKVLSTAVRTLLTTMSEKRLTQREREVLRLIGQGFNNREIADRLFITRETVRWHVRSLYSKIGTSDRKRVTAFANAEERFAS